MRKTFLHRVPVSRPVPARIRSWLFLLLCLLMAGSAFAQQNRRSERLFEKAHHHFSRHSYGKAINFCEKILEKDPAFTDAHLLLADIYREEQNREKELFHLEKAAELTDNKLVELRLGRIYYSMGNYGRALTHFENYPANDVGRSGVAEEVKRRINSCRFALEAMKNPVDFNPVRLSGDINSSFDEYWPSLTMDEQQLVFTRRVKEPGRLPQEDFYFSVSDSAGWGPAGALEELNTGGNEGAQSISGDGKMLFFTACNRRDGLGSCDIYYALQENGCWSRPVNAGDPVNSPHWEAQPSISPDGRTLYFSSNRPGGKGKKDIWLVECRGVNASGRLEWGELRNAGDSINTPGNEISPFMHASNASLYFASDYHTGMGGTDLFMATLRADTVFSRPQNLGYPVNTLNDEQGLFINTSGQTAYFASARPENSGLDIFTFRVDPSIRPEPATYLYARVVDSLSGKPVRAGIELNDLTHAHRKPRTARSDQNGELLLCLPAGANYALSVSKTGYLFYSDAFFLKEPRNFYDPYERIIRLKPVKAGSVMNLHNIYFATDSFSILPPSEPELMKLVEFLKDNPGLAVEVQGHTDNTGSTGRNRELSILRAQSVAEYLRNHGIRESRLKTAGYGETRPVATNQTPEGRRMNRRTTIKILGK